MQISKYLQKLKKVLQSNVIDRKVKESAVSHFDDYSKVFGF